MNCRDVSNQIATYLDDEVSLSEKKLILAHLTTCEHCQHELEVLGTLRKDIRQHLQIRSAAVTPSPQAWATLKASLPASPPCLSALEKVVRLVSFPGRLSLEGLQPNEWRSSLSF
jgi:anti-sigma factor RsiW